MSVDEVAVLVTRDGGREVLVVHPSPVQWSYWHVVAGRGARRERRRGAPARLFGVG